MQLSILGDKLIFSFEQCCLPAGTTEAAAVAAKVVAGIFIGFPSDPWTVTVPSGPGFNCPNWACATNAGGITTGLPSEPAIVTGPKRQMCEVYFD